MPDNFNPQNKKTMLTIDGGGARGIIPLMALLRLEEVTGKTVPELFDFVGGTSVGALIAAGIAAGRSAGEMIELYERFVHSIFRLDYVALAFRHGFRYLYDKGEMRGLLREYVGEVKMSELERAVLITAKDMARSETIFFVNRGPGAAISRDLPLILVAEASASAPVYFEPVGDAVDGGVGTYGNACYVATVEALAYISREEPDWRDGNVIHCSFGTGLSSNRLRRGEARRWLPLRWPLWVMGEALEEAIENNVQLTLRHFGQRIDFRRYEVSLEDEVVRRELGVRIPPGMRSNDLSLDSVSPAQIALMKDIGRAYAAGLDFSLTGEQLRQNPPPGYAGHPYPPRLPPLTEDEVRRMLGLG